jgi:hypothetical protein
MGGRGTPLDLFMNPYTPELTGANAAKTLMVFALPEVVAPRSRTVLLP